jgi:HEAT repeat protein
VRLVAPLVALALAAGAAPGADAPPSPEVKAQVEGLLGSIHGPVAPETFRALGPGAEEALAEIALSGDLPVRRARALEALAALRAPRAEEAHRRVLAEAATPRTVRRSAVQGLGALLAPPAALEALRPILERDRDPGLRAAAAQALARAAPGRACAAIRAQVAREPPSERGRFRHAIAACADR